MRCRQEEEEDAAAVVAVDFNRKEMFLCLDLTEQDLQEWVL